MRLDDPDLSARIKERDPIALKIVIEAYLGQILRAARAAGLDEHEAEDVTQSTFTTFIEKAENFDGRSHVRTWLFGILYKKILERHRETRRRSRFDDIETVMEERFKHNGSWQRPPEQVDSKTYHREIRRSLEECLDEVPAKQRMAFILREVEGYATEEICKILEITRTNLGAILFRCRNRLRECLEAKGIKGSKDAEM